MENRWSSYRWFCVIRWAVLLAGIAMFVGRESHVRLGIVIAVLVLYGVWMGIVSHAMFVD